MKKTFFISLLAFSLSFIFSYPNFNVKGNVNTKTELVILKPLHVSQYKNVSSTGDSKLKSTSKIVRCRTGVISNNSSFFYTNCYGTYFSGGAEAGSDICLNTALPYSTNIIVGGTSSGCL